MSFTGKEKTLVATFGGALTSGLTSASAFVAPDSTVGHVITGTIAVVGFLSTALGVFLVPNTQVAAAVTAVGGAVVSLHDELAGVPDVPTDLPSGALDSGAHSVDVIPPVA